jgi:hypothetical protein
MKNRPLTRILRLAGVTAGAVLALACSAHAGLQIPYTPDADTLHLWHFDDAPEVTLNLTDAVVSASSITLVNGGSPKSVFVPAYSSLGLCASNNANTHVLYDTPGGGYFPDVSQFCNPVSGAFTLECIVKFSGSGNLKSLPFNAELVAGDDNGGLTARGWQWRINTAGKMEWNLIAGNGSDNAFQAPLPASGSNSAVFNSWYHAAVTFTGYNPTNGDPAGVLKFYWTLLDPSRTNADVLATFNMTRSLGGATYANGALTGTETATPALGVGGSARNVSNGNNEGLNGLMDEARISDVARPADQMAFGPGGYFPPVIVTQPPANTLVGYGKPLVLPVVVSGSAPLFYRWLHQGTNLPGQITSTLSIPSADFSAAGNYQMIVTNSLGSATSMVANVVVGAAPSELFSTGLDANGALGAGNIPDPHWSLHRSSDPAYLGPAAMIFEINNPLQFVSDGQWATTNDYSMWIAPGGNSGGYLVPVAGGSYTYRTRFLLDTVAPATLTLQANLAADTSITDIQINGHSTGVTWNRPALYWDMGVLFTNSSFFVPGINTLDVIVSNPNDAAGLRVDQLQGVGQALAPGLPVILTQPASQTVRDASAGAGSKALLSVVACGRPPLSYQWWADGAPLSGATGRTLTYPNPTAGAQGTHYSVVVANDSGSVTSQVATLTLVSTNQPPVAANYNLVLFPGQNLSLNLSQLIEDSVDPDADALSYSSADYVSTNGSSVSQVGANLVYSPTAGYVGPDQFSYTVSDLLGSTAQGYVNILTVAPPAPFTTVLVGGSTNLNLGVSALLPGCAAQWQLNGTNLPGATATQLTIANAQAANVGAYRLAISESSGQTITSPTALVGLNGAPGPKFNSVPSGWAFNGYGTATALSNNVLTLVDGATGQGRSAWFTWPQNLNAFSASFVYQDIGGGGADGFAFVLQNASAGTAALGAGGGGLAYLNIANSVAFEFNIYSKNTVGVGLTSGGFTAPSFLPTDPAVNLASGNPIRVDLSYTTGSAQLTLTDLSTLLSTNLTFDVVAQLGDTFENLIGSPTAYVGFTGADGGIVSRQTISNFVFRPPSVSVGLQAKANNNSMLLSWTPSYSGFVLQSANTLSGPWQNVTAPVQAVGSQYQVTVPAAAGTQFYRLSLP